MYMACGCPSLGLRNTLFYNITFYKCSEWSLCEWMFRLLFVGMVWSSRTTCFCRLLLETWDGGCISVDDMHSLLVFPSFVFWRGQIWRPQLMSCNHPGFITPHAVRMSAAYHCCVQSLYLYKKKKRNTFSASPFADFPEKIIISNTQCCKCLHFKVF